MNRRSMLASAVLALVGLFGVGCSAQQKCCVSPGALGDNCCCCCCSDKDCQPGCCPECPPDCQTACCDDCSTDCAAECCAKAE